MKFWQKLTALWLFLSGSLLSAAPKVHILWLMHNDNPFWTQSQTIAKEAAADLGIETSFLLATAGDRLSAFKVAEKALSELKQEADTRYYFVGFGNFVDVEKILKLAGQKNLPVFFFNSAPSFPIKVRSGAYPHILGAMYPNDEEAGYKQAKALIAEARQRKSPEPQHIIALGGWSRDTVDEERRRGLLKAAVEEKAIVDQYFQTRWDKDVAKSHILRARQKFPATRIYWNIADYLGLGTLEWLAQDASGLLVGGVDWSAEALSSLQKEQGLWVSVGGHFLEPAWVTALLYDHAQGLDFIEIYPGGIVQSPMEVIDRSRVKDFLQRFPTDSWAKHDYRKLTRTHSKQMNYDFRLENLKP